MSDKKALSIKRALETAAKMFSELPFDEVQIAEIAARASCSTATIHAAFGTKRELFRLAVKYSPWRPWSSFPQPAQSSTLIPLMDHLSDRIAGHCKPELRTLIRSCTHEPMPYKETQENIRADSLLGELLTEVKRCMDCGLIREGNPREIAYLMIAGSGYEPIMHSLLFNGDLTRSTLLLIQTILGPFVTDKGRAELDRYALDWDGPACATSILTYMDDILMPDGHAEESAEGMLDADLPEDKARH